jgi:hypothetical protein
MMIHPKVAEHTHLVVLASSCTATKEGSPSAASPAGSSLSPVPTEGTSSAGPIQFVLGDTYSVGETAHVQIENVGDRSFRYRLSVSRRDQYAACPLHYSDGNGREFIIPPGTHCAIVTYGTIKPGETKPLFNWKLDECVKDAWGCVRSKPLSPGTYTITGLFKSENAQNSVRASGSFELLPVS